MSRPRALALLALLVLLIVPAAGCSSGGGGSSGAGRDCLQVGGATTIVAENVAWQTTAGRSLRCMHAKAGEKVTFTVDNRDSVRHNLHISGNGFSEKTELEAGPVTQELALTVPKAGTYRFVCDIHPNMTGTLTVS